MKHGFCKRQNKGVVFFSVPAFDALGFVHNGFTSRIGGVSKAPYDSLNLSFKRDPDARAVLENFAVAAGAIGVDVDAMVVCNYTHGDNVEFVGTAHHGMGITRENRLPPCDGVIVTDSSTVGVTIHADCCPIFFVDRKGRAAGVCHAGWKGTYLRIANTILDRLSSKDIRAEEVLFGIGPSICGQCYEVKEDVAGLFSKLYPDVVTQRDGKFYLDLPRTIAEQLIAMGVPEGNITLCGLCTYSERELFYSHRRDGLHAGAMGAFIAFDR